MMRELELFLGFEIKQLREGTFINQAKYTRDMLKRFKFEDAKGCKSPMSTSTDLHPDHLGKDVDQKVFFALSFDPHPSQDDPHVRSWFF